MSSFFGSTFSHKAHSSWSLYSILLCGWYSIHPTAFGHMGCFQVWAITSNAGMSVYSFLTRKKLLKIILRSLSKHIHGLCRAEDSCVPSESFQNPPTSSWEDPRQWTDPSRESRRWRHPAFPGCEQFKAWVVQPSLGFGMRLVKRLEWTAPISLPPRLESFNPLGIWGRKGDGRGRASCFVTDRAWLYLSCCIEMKALCPPSQVRAWLFYR